MASNEDGKLVERVAFCTVLCAGFAYASYNIVTKLFQKKSQPKETVNFAQNFVEDSSLKIYHSKGTQTKDLAKKLPEIIDKCISPKSVRERINDLNQMTERLRKSSIPLSPEIKPASFHGNLWSSPLGCAKYLSVSAENISVKSSCSSPEHKFKSKLTASQGALNEELQTRLNRLQLSSSLSEDFLQDDSILLKTLNNLQKAPSKMTKYEMKNLITLLNFNNEDVLLKTLYTISNCAAFTTNQILLCDHDCLKRLKELLLSQSEAIKVGVTQAISNMSVIDRSYQYFHSHIPILLNHSIYGNELLKSLSLTALANLALDNASHKMLMENIIPIMNMTRNGSSVVQLQSLRLLVNLSCNKDLVPSLLVCEVPSDMLEIINKSTDKEIILRMLTFLANIVTYAVQYLDGSSKCTLLSLIVQLKKQTDILNIISLISDKNDDISFQAKRLHNALLAVS